MDKKSVRPPSQWVKLDVLVCICHPSYTGSPNGRIAVQGGQGINVREEKKKKNPCIFKSKDQNR
jgi:hypothetical protein